MSTLKDVSGLEAGWFKEVKLSGCRLRQRNGVRFHARLSVLPRRSGFGATDFFLEVCFYVMTPRLPKDCRRIIFNEEPINLAWLPEASVSTRALARIVGGETIACALAGVWLGCLDEEATLIIKLDPTDPENPKGDDPVSLTVHVGRYRIEKTVDYKTVCGVLERVAS